MAHFWLVRGYLAEGRAWLEGTLRLDPSEISPLVHAQVLRKLATLEWRQGELDVAGARAERALPLLAGEIDEDERYRLLILLGCIEYSRRNREGSRDWWEQSAALARTLRNDGHLALALSNLGVVAAELEDYEGGVAIYEESVESARRVDHREYLAGALLGLGDMNLRLGRFEAGRAQLLESIELHARLGFRDKLASCCVWLAPAPEHDGDLALAARLLGAAAGIRRQTGASVDWQEQELLDELLGRLRPALGDAAFDEAFAAGEASPDDVLREVLASAAAPVAPMAGQRRTSTRVDRSRRGSLAASAPGFPGASAARAAQQVAPATASDVRIVDCLVILPPFRVDAIHGHPAAQETLAIHSRSAPIGGRRPEHGISTLSP